MLDLNPNIKRVKKELEGCSRRSILTPNNHLLVVIRLSNDDLIKEFLYISDRYPPRSLKYLAEFDIFIFVFPVKLRSLIDSPVCLSRLEKFQAALLDLLRNISGKTTFLVTFFYEVYRRVFPNMCCPLPLRSSYCCNLISSWSGQNTFGECTFLHDRD